MKKVLKNYKNSFIITILLISIFLTALYIWNDFQAKRAEFHNTIPSNIYLNEKLLSGKEASQIEDLVKEEENSFRKNAIIEIVKPDGSVVASYTIGSDDVLTSYNTTDTIKQLQTLNRLNGEDNWQRLVNDFKQVYIQKTWAEHSLETSWTIQESKIETLISQINTDTVILANDASVTYQDNKPVVITSREGQNLSEEQQKYLRNELLNFFYSRENNSASLTATLTIIPPKVKTEDLPKTIVISRSKKTLDLYDRNGNIEKSYRVAVGTSAHPTPAGDWRITLKRYAPTWVNPGSAWAKGMPSSIPPGPGNPLGPRALNLNADGIRIHGTYEYNSIGTAASHGCIRMMPKDVIELYDLVEVGTLVYIR